ncbi:MAG TPA: DUF3459 domain-containing protein, partial [Croceibacterium sp.]
IGTVAIPPDRVRDPRELRQPGIGLGRDPCRTPMPWDRSPHAGFSAAEPWLPLNPDWQERNVAVQDADPRSMLALTRALLRLRRAEDALAVGDYRQVACEGTLLAYERRSGATRLLVVLNLGADSLPMPAAASGGARVLSTLSGHSNALRGNEGVILKLPD